MLLVLVALDHCLLPYKKKNMAPDMANNRCCLHGCASTLNSLMVESDEVMRPDKHKARLVRLVPPT